MILNIGLALHLVVEPDQLLQLSAALPGPEERVLPRLDEHPPVTRQIDEPAHRLLRPCLRHRLNDALLDLVAARAREQLAEEAHVVRVAMSLTEPEDRLRPGMRGLSLV